MKKSTYKTITKILCYCTNLRSNSYTGIHFVNRYLTIKNMYHFQKNTLTEGKSCKYIIYQRGNQLSYIDFITLLQQEEQFRSFFISLLSDITFHAYQWETPPVNSSTVNQPFEFVIQNSPGIDLPPDPQPFRQYFNNLKSDNEIAVFSNLGNDATLIAPAPPSRELNYSHIGIFTKVAPMQQQSNLWQTAARITKEQISDQPLWLNTAGGGVAWLHIRLDSQPKYYQHQPYIATGYEM